MFKKFFQFIFKRKILLNIILILFAWIILIWSTLTYFDSYTNHGEEIEVPSLLGNNVKDVPDLLTGTTLKYEIIDSVYNPSLLEGTIIYQLPLPSDSTGMMVKNGRIIKIRVSKQSRLVEAPLVVSKSLRFAEAVITAKGLRTKITFVPSNEDQGSVIDQKYKGKSISKGTKIPINSIIELVVGRKTGDEFAFVPNVVGLSIIEAQTRMTNLNLLAIYSDCQSKQDSLDAIIINQSPIGDSSRLPFGSVVTVFATPNKSE